MILKTMIQCQYRPNNNRMVIKRRGSMEGWDTSLLYPRYNLSLGSIFLVVV